MEHLSDDDLDEIVGTLREVLDPVAIILYGSHAYGNPDEGSDVDVFVVVEATDEPPHRLEARAYRHLYESGLPVEVRVKALEEFRKRRTWVNSLERTVAERGQVLYGSTDRGRPGLA